MSAPENEINGCTHVALSLFLTFGIDGNLLVVVGGGLLLARRGRGRGGNLVRGIRPV